MHKPKTLSALLLGSLIAVSAPLAVAADSGYDEGGRYDATRSYDATRPDVSDPSSRVAPAEIMVPYDSAHWDMQSFGPNPRGISHPEDYAQ